jgi:hypothetical protein
MPRRGRGSAGVGARRRALSGWPVDVVKCRREFQVLSVALPRLPRMLRPASWTGLAGGSPVPVGTGAPGSRPRSVVETRRAERGVESLFGGSKCAGRSVKRTLQPRQSHNGRAEPLMSRRRSCPASPWSGVSSSGLSGVREAARAHSLVRNRRDPSAWPSSGKDQGYKPMVKALGGALSTCLRCNGNSALGGAVNLAGAQRDRGVQGSVGWVSVVWVRLRQSVR